MSIPSRTSDAGPDERGDRQGYEDYLEAHEEAMREDQEEAL